MNKDIGPLPVAMYEEDYARHGVTLRGFVMIGIWFVIFGFVTGIIIHFVGYAALGLNYEY